MKAFFQKILENVLVGEDNHSKAKLIQLAVNTLYFISDDEDYRILKQLISLNKELNRPIKNIEEQLFMKCNEEYRFKMWADKYVDICPTNRLKKEFKSTDNAYLYELMAIEDTQIQVFFEDIEEHLLKALKSASKSIKVAMAWFTNPTIFNLLLRLLKKDIEITIVINNDLINNGGHSLDFQTLIDAGAHIHLINGDKLLHHKFCIIDNEILINGSYNWTISAEHYNHENLMIIKNKTSVVNQFVDKFDWLTDNYEKVETMPDYVPVKLEYDKFSYKYLLSSELIKKAESTQSDYLKKRYYFEALKLANYDCVRRVIPSQYLDEYNNIPYFAKYENEENITTQLSENTKNELLSELSKIEIQKEKISLKVEKLKKDNQKIKEQFADNIRDVRKQDAESDINDLKRERRKQLDKIKKRLSLQEKELATLQNSHDVLESQLELNDSTKDILLQGSRGNLRINLLWKTIDDLDLHLTLPNGNDIFYDHMSETYKGREIALDYDANAGSPFTTDPQENISCRGILPDGDYKINVMLFKYRSHKKRISFVVTVIPDVGTPIRKTFTFTDLTNKTTMGIGTIRYRKQKGMTFLPLNNQ